MATLEGGAAYGGGLVLGGAAVAGRVALPPLQVSGGALSVSAWVYLAGAADAFSLPLLELGAHGRALALGVHGATARVALRDGAGAAAQAVSWSLALAPNLMGPNAWHHIALVLDADGDDVRQITQMFGRRSEVDVQARLLSLEARNG